MAEELKRTVLFELEVDSSGAITGMKKVEEQIGKTGKAVDDTSEKMREGTKETGSYSSAFGALDKAMGGAITKTKGLLGGIKSLTGGFNGLKGAIIASGIGALVITLVAVIQAFRNSEEGQNKFAKLMGVIGVVVGNVVDVLSDFGEFVINLFSGDSEAIKSLESFGKAIFDTIGLPIKNAISVVKALASAFSALVDGEFQQAFDALENGAKEVGANIGTALKTATNIYDGVIQGSKEYIAAQKEEIKLSQQVSDQRAKADKLERELLVRRSELEAQIADLKLKSRQEEQFSATQRAQFLKDAQKLEDELLIQETEVLALRRDAITTENTFARSNKENLRAEAEAIAAVNNKTAERLNSQRQTQRELQRINGQIKTANAEQLKALEAEKKAIEEKSKAELEALQEFRDAEAEYDLEQKEKKAAQDALDQARTDKALQAIKEIEYAQQTADALRLENEQEKYDALLLIADKKYQDELLLAEGNDAEQLLAYKKYLDAKKKLDDGAQSDEKKRITFAQAADKATKEEKLQAGLQVAKATSDLTTALFGQTKAGAIVEAAINTALGITAALKSPLTAPFVIPIISGLGLAQIAAIASQKPPPPPNLPSGKFARGGMISGRLHSQGGTMIEAESGEAIVNRRTMANPFYRSLISAMNEAGGGVKFARGGMVGLSESQAILQDSLNNFANNPNLVPVLVTEDFNIVENRVAVTEQISTF